MTYRWPARVFHWGMAFLVLATIPVGLLMVQNGLDRSLQNALFVFHKNVGVILIGLVVARLLYRWRYPAPPLPAHMPDWQIRVSQISHLGLYLLLILVPVAGYVRVRAGGFPIEMLDAAGISTMVPRSDALAEVAKTVHYFGGIAIALLIVVHIGAALHHGLIKKDGIFTRIWPPFGTGKTR